MISNFNAHLEMLVLVARAMGSELLDQVAFVGGSTTGLLITDLATKESVRYTSDVDVIISVMAYPEFHRLSENLQSRGFKFKLEDVDDALCSMWLGGLRVDFMPEDGGALGFTNFWYSEALLNSVPHELEPGLTIKILTAPYFLGTKFEAFKGRGNGDVMASHDIEDVLNVIDGREEVIDEVRGSPNALREYLAEQFQRLLAHEDIQYTIQGNLMDAGREQLLFERLETLARL